MPGIETLAPDQAPRRDFEIGIVEDDRRVLPPQFQGDGREVGCSTFQNLRADPSTTGEEDVIKALTHEVCGHRCVSIHHGHHVLRKMLGNQPFNQLRGGRSMFRRLDHGSVPGGQCAHKGPQGETEWQIPGADQ